MYRGTQKKELFQQGSSRLKGKGISFLHLREDLNQVEKGD